MAEQTTEKTDPQSVVANPRRPFSVTLVALAVLTIAVVHLIRMVDAIQQWDFLASLLRVLPIYQALTGLAWMLAGMPVAWGLWRGKRWAPVVARIAVPAYLFYAWIDRVFIANREVTLSGDSSWPFMAVVTLVPIVLVFWILSRSKVLAFFRRDS